MKFPRYNVRSRYKGETPRQEVAVRLQTYPGRTDEYEVRKEAVASKLWVAEITGIDEKTGDFKRKFENFSLTYYGGFRGFGFKVNAYLLPNKVYQMGWTDETGKHSAFFTVESEGYGDSMPMPLSRAEVVERLK